MEIEASIIAVTAACAILFILWKLWLIVLWRTEKGIFFRGVRDYLEKDKKAAGQESEEPPPHSERGEA